MNGGAKEGQGEQHLSCGVAPRVGRWALVGGTTYHDWWSPVNNFTANNWMLTEKPASQIAKGQVAEMPAESTFHWYLTVAVMGDRRHESMPRTGPSISLGPSKTVTSQSFWQVLSNQLAEGIRC